MPLFQVIIWHPHILWSIYLLGCLFSYCWVLKSSLYILDISSLLDVWLINIFCLIQFVFFIILTIFCRAKVFNFHILPFYQFTLWIVHLVFYLRTLCVTQGHEDFFSCILFSEFYTSTFCVYDSFWNNFCVICKVIGRGSFFCIWMSNFSNTTCCKGYPFFIELPLNFCQKWIFHLLINIIMPITGLRKIRCIRKKLWIMIETIQ